MSCCQVAESALQHKVDMVTRLESRTTQMVSTIQDLEERLDHQILLISLHIGSPMTSLDAEIDLPIVIFIVVIINHS